MELSRVYKNSSDDIIRIDTIYLRSTGSEQTTGPVRKTWIRTVDTSLVLESSDRTVSSIQLVTDADTYDSSASGPQNYTWVSWSTHGGVRCDMSDLPVIGETV